MDLPSGTREDYLKLRQMGVSDAHLAEDAGMSVAQLRAALDPPKQAPKSLISSHEVAARREIYRYWQDVLHVSPEDIASSANLSTTDFRAFVLGDHDVLTAADCAKLAEVENDLMYDGDGKVDPRVKQIVDSYKGRK